MNQAKLLIVDDDFGILKQLKWALSADYQIFTAATKEEAIRIGELEKPELVTLDVNLSGGPDLKKEGIEILDQIKDKSSFSKVIMITGNDTRELALEAIGKGAFDYYLKPIDIDELKIILRRALYIQNLEKENRLLIDKLDQSFKFEDMVGASSGMEKIYSLVRRVAPTDATVLITGESGTGKELVARAIHCLSSRQKHPFIVINCGAIPENLLESELFGHEKGSFTDAFAQRIGKLELADKGTVFLDEIGEMSLHLQVKMLRFLQERIIERVGGNTPIELDVRIIAATNSNLNQKIKQATFREDLYYRLSVIRAELPALRERGEDVLLLANYFLHKYKKEVSTKDIKGFSREAKDVMMTYAWPGNVREVENRVKRAVILAENSLIKPYELGFESQGGKDSGTEKLSLKDARRDIEIRLIKKAFVESKGNLSLVAKMLGITRPTLYDLIKKYSLNL